MKSTEKSTQKACMQYLDARGIFYYRQNSGTFDNGHGGYYSFGMKGAPDLICVVKGIYIGLEIKDVKGKQNENQILFQQRLEKAGGRYYVIRSIDELIALKL